MSALGNIGGRLYRGEVSVNFVGRKKLWYLISGAILLVSLIALGVRGLNYSIDFKGGSVFEFCTPTVNATRVASVVTAAGGGANPTVLEVTGGRCSPTWQVETQHVTASRGQIVVKAIEDHFHLSNVSYSFIGATWGGQITQKALIALIAFLIVVVLYLSIAFEWKMASAAFVALAHDILITVGVYALTGFQVSPATVIGLLTILGYSLYDTVVVFDKVRENTAGILGIRRSSYSEAANLALNQTLVRSINTSVIALLPVTAILLVGINLLGNGELKDLSLVLFVGMLSGTYSSICIATPVLADLKEREPQYRQLAQQMAMRAAGGRAAQRRERERAALATAASADGAGRTPDGDTPNGPEERDGPAGPPEDAPGSAEPVSAGSSTGPGRPAQRGGGSVRPVGPRQQPRRTSAARRRPAGKKKRR